MLQLQQQQYSKCIFKPKCTSSQGPNFLFLAFPCSHTYNRHVPLPTSILLPTARLTGQGHCGEETPTCHSHWPPPRILPEHHQLCTGLGAQKNTPGVSSPRSSSSSTQLGSAQCLASDCNCHCKSSIHNGS